MQWLGFEKGAQEFAQGHVLDVAGINNGGNLAVLQKLAAKVDGAVRIADKAYPVFTFQFKLSNFLFECLDYCVLCLGFIVS